ncbi:MAG: D-hexose-6-phosphate mutarotase [Gemmatimonadaceae bacterium]
MTTSDTTAALAGDQRSRLVLAAADGARAELYLHGAHVSSWIPAGGGERLFLSSTAVYRDGLPIRGGVPVIFPQFADRGPLPKHGFARTARWSLVSSARDAVGCAIADLRLTDDDESRRLWPHAFVADLTVRVGGDALELSLAVRNRGADPLSFTTALHTYLRVRDIAGVALVGLRGVTYTDSAHGGRSAVQLEERLRFEGEMDRVYVGAPAHLLVDEASHQTRVEASGFVDCVVWNPGATRGASFDDLEPGGYARFVCVEAAVAASPVVLAPGQSWQGTQRLIATTS